MGLFFRVVVTVTARMASRPAVAPPALWSTSPPTPCSCSMSRRPISPGRMTDRTSFLSKSMVSSSASLIVVSYFLTLTILSSYELSWWWYYLNNTGYKELNKSILKYHDMDFVISSSNKTSWMYHSLYQGKYARTENRAQSYNRFPVLLN